MDGVVVGLTGRRDAEARLAVGSSRASSRVESSRGTRPKCQEASHRVRTPCVWPLATRENGWLVSRSQRRREKKTGGPARSTQLPGARCAETGEPTPHSDSDCAGAKGRRRRRRQRRRRRRRLLTGNEARTRDGSASRWFDAGCETVRDGGGESPVEVACRKVSQQPKTRRRDVVGWRAARGRVGAR